MSLFGYRRHRPQPPHPNATLTHHPCPLCGTATKVPLSAAHIQAGTLGAVITYPCPGCAEERRTPLNPALYRQLSDSWCKIVLDDDELLDGVRSLPNSPADQRVFEGLTGLELQAPEYLWEQFIGQYKSEHKDEFGA